MKELKVTPIKNGTVIDHIPPGFALKVLDKPKLDNKLSIIIILRIFLTSLSDCNS